MDCEAGSQVCRNAAASTVKDDMGGNGWSGGLPAATFALAHGKARVSDVIGVPRSGSVA
jgi:hypothetical protein